MTDNVGSRLESATAKIKEESERVLIEKENALILLKAETTDKLNAMEEKCTSLTKGQSQHLFKRLLSCLFSVVII